MATLTNFIILLHLIAYCFILPTLTNSESKKDYINLSENYFQSNNIPNTPKKQIVMNAIDSCWRTNSKWASNRQSLANCAKGFGSNATGGKFGEIYEVTNPSDDPLKPKEGTLRYGVIQTKPLWITFAKDMVIKLKNELMLNSYKTIDGRGFKVEIANGACITIHNVSHVIVHGIMIHYCKPSNPGLVRSSSIEHAVHRQRSDGDGISVFASSNIWIDHCFLSRCTDGLIDVIHNSTNVTISNNYFTLHDKVSKYTICVFFPSNVCMINYISIHISHKKHYSMKPYQSEGKNVFGII